MHISQVEPLKKQKNNMEEEFEDISFLDQDKLKKQEKKIEDGEITCSIDKPEDCEPSSG